MGGGGSDSKPVYTDTYNPDQAALTEFINNSGKKYAGTYKQVNSFGDMQYSSGPSGFNANGAGAPDGGVDVTDMLNAFQAWQKDQKNAKTAWSNYADLVAKQGGGQGQQTVLGSPTDTSAIGAPLIKPPSIRAGK